MTKPKILGSYPAELKEFLRDFDVAPYANFTKADMERIEKDIAEKRAKIEELKKEIMGATAVMKTMCTHEDVRVESYYRSGDYHNTSYTTYTVKCYVCGDEMFECTKHGGSYS